MSKKKKTLDELLEEALVPENEQPYEIPENWVWTNMKSVGMYHNGRAFKSGEWEDSGRPIIRIQDLTGTNKGNPNYYKGEVASKHEVKKGDLLISWSATLGAFIWEGEDAVLNQHIFKVESFIHKKYHYYATKNIISTLMNKTHGSGMVHVTKNVFDLSPLPLPPINEQKRIANKIEILFSKIDEAKQLIEEASVEMESSKKSIVSKAISGELTKKWRNDNSKYLQSDKTESTMQRCKYKLEEITEIQLGKMLSRKAYSEELEMLPYLRNANIQWGKIETDDVLYMGFSEKEKEKFRLKQDDLLVCEGGIVGRTAIWNGEIENCMYQKALHRLRVKKEMVNPKWLYYFMLDCHNRGIFESMTSQTTIRHLTREKLKLLEVILPSLEEQNEIIRVLEDTLNKLERINETIPTSSEIESLKGAILSKAFKGELGTNDPTDEPAIDLLKSILQEKL